MKGNENPMKFQVTYKPFFIPAETIVAWFMCKDADEIYKIARNAKPEGYYINSIRPENEAI